MGGYLLYREGKEKLSRTDIPSRIEAAHAGGGLNLIYGYKPVQGLAEVFDELGEEGYLGTEAAAHVNAVRAMIREPCSHRWTVHEPGGSTALELSDNDAYTVSGVFASLVLAPDEWLDARGFGMGSVAELHGLTAALIFDRMTMWNTQREAYTWTSHQEGNTLRNTIGGSSHLDLTITQEDETEYPTQDPWGENVSYRPRHHQYRGYVPDAKDGEVALLQHTLAWAHQMGLTSEYLDNPFQVLRDIQEVSVYDLSPSAERHLILPAESLPEGTPQPPRVVLQSTYGAGTPAFILDGDLCYGAGEEDIRARFVPSDLDHLIRGVFTQAAKAAGRTHPHTLYEALTSFIEQERHAR